MNYEKIYNNLIERSKSRALEGYKERHHILPRCMGGNDDASNICDLTPEEHYLAHQLLVKIHPNNQKLVKAAVMMVANRPSNKLYGWLKRRFSEVQRAQQLGNKNSQFGTRWIHNETLRKNKKIMGHLPLGWKEGRKLKWESNEKYCKYCNQLFFPQTKELFCSASCKKYSFCPTALIIDKNLESIINTFIETKSIDRTLKKHGIDGNRKGNSYLSSILKSKGITVLRRRNTSALKT